MEYERSLLHEKDENDENKQPRIPEQWNWQSLLVRDGKELEDHYKAILAGLSNQEGMLGIIFRKAINKIQNPAHLRRLIVDLINDINWLSMEADVKGDAYEGLLQKNAEDTKSGAGQYFTPRDLIRAIVEVMQPAPMQTVCDPACGTGGFLLAAHDYISTHYDMGREARHFLKDRAFQGWEIVDGTARLCIMNMFLHGIGDESSPNAPIHVFDSLRIKPSERFDIVLSNPPFGRKSSLSLNGGSGKKKGEKESGAQERESANVNRDDFWTSTSNKQLNFVQHIYNLLKVNGRAAVVVPDNVLFEGGAGETIRRNLLQTCDVHTLLRLPTGIFYAQGVKANVLFFDKRQASFMAQTERLWVYDLRTNMNFTLRTNPLKQEHLADFIACYNPSNRRQRQESERFHSFSYEELLKRDKLSLDLFWLRDESLEGTDNLPPPAEIAASIVEDLQNALDQFKAISEDLRRKASVKAEPLYL